MKLAKNCVYENFLYDDIFGDFWLLTQIFCNNHGDTNRNRGKQLLRTQIKILIGLFMRLGSNKIFKPQKFNENS